MASVHRTVISVAGAPIEADEEDDDVTRPLPDRLITELTAHRTLALRDALAENPAIAFQAVLHNFVLAAFYRFASSGSCLEIGLRTPTFPAQAPGLRESASAKAIEARHESWKARLPKGENDLWDGSQRSTAPHRRPCSLTARHLRSTRSTSRPTATIRAASPPTASARGSIRPMCWRARSDSTWCRPAGDRRSTTISAGSPSLAFWRRCGRPR